MAKFSISTANKMVDSFSVYLQSMRQSTLTREQYIAIVRNFLLSYVVNKVDDASYEEVFTENNITGFIKERKSNIVRAALNNFVKCLVEQGLVFRYYQIPKEWFESSENGRRETKNISINDVQYILSDECKYHNEGEKLRAQLICVLCFYCYFEQKHLRSIKLADIEDQYIRNLRRTDETPYLVQRVLINPITYDVLNRYIAHFFPQGKDTDSNSFLFWIEGLEQSDANLINIMLRPFDRAENKGFLSNKIDCQSLCFSGMLLWLRATQGTALTELMQLVEYGNSQFTKAYQFFFQYLSTNIQINDYISIPKDITIFNAIQEEFVYDAEDIVTEQHDIIPSNDFDIESNPYIEELDVTEDDIMSFDSFSLNNQTTNNVQIERMVRLTKLSDTLKQIYGSRCQLCGTQLRRRNGDYFAEAHHIRPYNRTHQGNDAFSNMIILCPNCHSQFDQLYYAIEPDTQLVHCVYPEDKFHLVNLNLIPKHRLDKASLVYTWERFQSSATEKLI